MKRFAIAALAALTMAGPLAATAAYADPPGRHDNNDRNDRNDRNDNNRGSQRWDDARYNGYYVGNRFYRGTPSVAQQRRNDFRPAWQTWRRGERLSSYQRAHYRQIDYRSSHLRAPPRGYHYVRDDRNQILLVAITTGIIASIIASR
jgi:Ni/Co efflux regulator RcnB